MWTAWFFAFEATAGARLGVAAVVAHEHDHSVVEHPALLEAFDERANLGSIRIPTLCLAGAHDRNAPASMMERMTAKIPGAAYHCIEGVGHLANLEAPDRFNAAVLAFLRRIFQA